MSQSLVQNIHHTIFSTKNRHGWIEDYWANDLYRYVAGILKRLGCKILLAGGTSDHIHILSSIGKTLTVPEFVRAVKSSSTSWIRRSIPGKKSFAWQKGYASFSVDKSRIPDLKKYIQNQNEHHRHRNFKDELKELLDSHNMKYDERYLWN